MPAFILFLLLIQVAFTTPLPSPADTNKLNQDFEALTVLSNAATERVNNWVNQPGYRGTWDILWTCLVTIFICTWTLLCLNVPPPDETLIKMMYRRIFWMGFAIVAPEIVLTYAAGQWSRARQSVEAFDASGYPDWTMRLAFFADMGGFVLKAPDCERFPLNAKQLHWLVTNEYIKYPEVSAEEMWDKSKQDRFSKVITSFQVGYLVLQCIGRAAQHLEITTLELNALAIVVCSLMTAFAWLHKPTDIRTPICLTATTSIKNVTEGRSWKFTPLDFVDENGPGWAVNVQPFMRMPVIPEARPIQAIPNDRFPMDPYGSQEYFLCLATLLFTGIHVAGWNFAFSSTWERLLWRISSLILFGVTALFWLFETMASWTRLGRWKWLYLKLTCRKQASAVKRRSSDKQETATRDSAQLPLPWEFWTIFPIALLYGVARFYLIAEAFMELRRVEASAYINVDWSAYIPHI